MLRRVARVLRVGLFVVALALVLWIPVSFMYHAWCVLPPTAANSIGFISERGAVFFYVVPDSFAGADGVHWGVEEGLSLLFAESDPFLPRVKTDQESILATVPLWLLAFLCLAWPVTSFVIARRRRRTRGFEVEAVVKDDGGSLR